MSGDMGSEELDVLASRLEFIQELSDGPLHKPDLVEEFHHSRSTVDRAIEELENAGFVERVSRGYVATQTGRLVADQYCQFLDSFESQLSAADVVDAVPVEHELPSALFEEATVESIGGSHELFAHVTDIIGTGEDYRIMLPNVFDSRHVKIWHSQVVRGNRSIELFTDELVLDQLASEFPELTNELADTTGFTAHEIETPPFGLITVPESAQRASPRDTRDASTSTVLVITYENGEIEGIVETSGEQAQAWATEQFQQFRELGERATEQLWSADIDSDLGLVSGTKLSPSLRSEGFELIDEQFFADREPIPPETGWRAGLGLTEVADGQAVDREHDDELLSETVSDMLESGNDIAVLGPAGSGKSTLCKQVACQWADKKERKVIYRESGQGQPFSAVRMLEDHLREATGKVLVVVEDAIRAEASEIFAVMHRLAGREDIVFLLDAREQEWHDTDSPLDARLDAFRHSTLNVVSMPAFDEDDCSKLISTAESLLETTIEVEPAQLLAEVREGNADGGTVLLLIHRLAKLADPLSEYERSGATTLEEDIDRVWSDLDAIGETALDVGFLANLLNATNHELHPELLYTVALDETDTSIDQIHSAIERLEGHVLLSRQGETQYHGIHEAWSEQFLKRSLEKDGEHIARERFNRCLSVLYRLASEPTQCDRLVSIVDCQTTVVETIVSETTDWLDKLVESVYELGQKQAYLAPLFRSEDDSHATLLDHCSLAVKTRCIDLRGQLFLQAGAYEQSKEAFERLVEIATTHESMAHYETTGLIGQGRTYLERGVYDRAREYLERSLEIARRKGEKRAVATSLLKLATVFSDQESYEKARSYNEESLEIYRDIGSRYGEAQAIKDIGTMAWYQGNLSEATAYYEQCLDIAVEIGDRKTEAIALENLGVVKSSTGEQRQACEYLEQALVECREIGDRAGEASVLQNLGVVLELRAEYDRASTSYQESLAIRRAIGDTRVVEVILSNLGVVARKQGRYEQAQQYFAESLELSRDDKNKNEHTTLGSLALLERSRGNYEQSKQYYQQALERVQDIDAVKPEIEYTVGLSGVFRKMGDNDTAQEKLQRARTLLSETETLSRVRAKIRLEQAQQQHKTEPAEAREHVQEALDVFENEPHWAGRCQQVLGELKAAQNRYEKARDHLADALETFETVGAPHESLQTIQLLVGVCRESGDTEHATEYLERGRERLEKAPDPVREQYRDWFEQASPKTEC